MVKMELCCPACRTWHSEDAFIEHPDVDEDSEGEFLDDAVECPSCHEIFDAAVWDDVDGLARLQTSARGS